MGHVTIAQLLRNAAVARPDHAAYHYSRATQTWREVDERVDALAAGLWEAGVRPGDVVASCTHDGPVLIELIYAAARIGAVRVGINYRLSPNEALGIIEHSGAKLVIAQHDFLPLVAQARPALGLVDAGDGQAELGDYARLLEPGAKPPPVAVDENAMAQICYTTGSTGKPKGAIWSHRATLHAMGHTLLDLGFGKDEVWLHCFPGAGVPCLLAIWNVLLGFTSVIMPAFEPDRMLELVERHRVTRLIVVPTMLAAACDAVERKPRDVSSLQRLSYGSAPTPPAMIRRSFKLFPGVELEQWYGSTEGVGGWFSKLTPEEHRRAVEIEGCETLLESCGRAMHHSRLEVVGADGKPCAAGEIGEVRISGGFLMDGYYNEPEMTQKTLRDGWLYTGDMGRLDEDGYLYLVDRKQFMIITGGYNVYPIEIENVIAAHPAVAEVCVFGVPDPKWGEAVHAAVAVRPGVEVDEGAIVAWCRERLAKFKVPKSVEFRDRLIRGATGKLLKRAERDRFLAASRGLAQSA